VTVITFVSVKGAPGVTTLACLVGATWPDQRRVAVVEADPFGGDLAARFRLPVSRGWSSYVTTSRRSEGPIPLEPHLQALPGGLDVMIGARGGRLAGAEQAVADLVQSSGSDPSPRDLVIDGGRLLLENAPSATAAWLDHSDVVVVVVRRDAPSILCARDRSAGLRDRFGDRVRLVVVGNGRHSSAAIEDFTRLAVIGEVPVDHAAAQVASGSGGAGWRLSRSLLVVSAHRLATVLAGPDHGDHTSDTVGEDGDRVVDEDRPVPTGPVAGSYRRYRRIRQLRHPVRRRPVDGGGGQATKAAVAPWSDGEPTVHRDDGGPEAAAGREIPAQDGSVPAPQEATL
jgi:MinD-like ATPase involved in chromosome partitioning or flagellar assembly